MKTCALGLFVCLLFAASRSGITAEEKPIQVTAVQIAADYTANEEAADKKYKGKTIEVTGIIESFDTIDWVDGKSFGVSLVTKQPIMVVQCMLGNPAKLANKDKLTVGREVVIVGRCDGGQLNVLLNDSKLLKWK